MPKVGRSSEVTLACVCWVQDGCVSVLWGGGGPEVQKKNEGQDEDSEANLFFSLSLTWPDIKRLYRQSGVELKTTSFLFVDTQIADDSFLEDINNILSSGEVPNLYKSDEFEEVQTLAPLPL
jgi:hypothetical protein